MLLEMQELSGLRSAYEDVLPDTPNILTEYDRHNRELKKIRGYMRGRKRKSKFEYDVLAHFDEYYEMSVMAYKLLADTNYTKMENEAKRIEICHRNYNYHNIIFCNDKVAIVNFEKAGAGLQIKDLYLFLRKVLEKHNWNLELGYNIIDRYNKVKPLNSKEYQILMVMLRYPEKF